MQKFCIAIFPLNSLKNQQQIDNAEILHFYFDTCKIWMQKFCRAIFPPNSLKDQQQMDNAKFRISSLTLTKSGRKNSAEPFSR